MVKTKKNDCMKCGAKKPVSAVWVRVEGVVVGTICASHTFHDIILDPGLNGKRFFVELSLQEDRKGD